VVECVSNACAGDEEVVMPPDVLEKLKPEWIGRLGWFGGGDGAVQRECINVKCDILCR
jgi:hypothetical protein